MMSFSVTRVLKSSDTSRHLQEKGAVELMFECPFRAQSFQHVDIYKCSFFLNEMSIFWFSWQYANIDSDDILAPHRQAIIRTNDGLLYKHMRDICVTWPQCRDHSAYMPSQWETALQCNAISHWLGAYTERSLQWVNHSLGFFHNMMTKTALRVTTWPNNR